tara:strand:- start:4459 stop:8331 length:3873 start_codon:yes stop_codon:yes gene_type:complete
MAAILKLRRGSSIPTLVESELFYHTGLDTLVVGNPSAPHSILIKSGSNTVDLVSISGTVSASYIHVQNDITIKGNIILGDSVANDNITINAELSSSLIPDSHNNFDIGSSVKKWRHIYAVSASIDDITLGGSGIVSSSQQISDYNTFLEIDGMGVFSGSSQVNANTITNFDSNVKDKMNDDGVISGSSQLTTDFDTRYLNTNGDGVISGSVLRPNGDSVVSSSAQISGYNTFLEINGDGVISSSAQLEGEFLQINGDGVFSGSSQVNADSIVNFDSNVKDKMNDDGVISGSSQLEGEFLQINGDSVVSSSAQISGYNTFLEINGDGVVSGSSQINSLFVGTSVSTSLDSRLDSLETDSHTHANKSNLDSIDQDLSTTDNVTFADGDFTGNVSVNGNLTVLGSATEIQTSELRIEDKLITVASGSADSAAADGAGLEIDGANKSMKWEHGTQQFVFDAKVSSSVGFKGEGGELTGIDTDQVTEATNLYYTNARVLSYIHDQGVVSGSSQVQDILGPLNAYTQSATFRARVDNYLDGGNGIAYGSGTIDVDGTVLRTVGMGVVSGSSQVTQSLDTRYLEIEGDSVVSGSSQIDVTATTNYGSINQYSNTKVKDKLNDEGVLSGSAQVVSSLPSGTVSGSTQITNGSSIVSSSVFSSPSQGTVRATINGTQTDVDTALQTTDSPTFQGVTLTNLSALGSGNQTALISGSGGSIGKRTLGTAAFFNVSASIGDDALSVPTTKAVNDALIEAGAGDITEVNPTNTFSPDNTGLVHLSSGTDVGGVKGVQGNIHISVSTGSVHFRDGVKEKLNAEGVVSGSTGGFLNANGDSVVSGSSQIDVTATTNYGSINQYSNTKVLNYVNDLGVISGSSQVNADSVTNFDSNVLSYINDLGVVSGSVVAELPSGTVSGSSQIDHNATTNYTASRHIDHSAITVGSGKGLSGGGTIDTNRSIFLDTGSAHFLDGIKQKLNSETVISGSSQITITQSQISDLDHYTNTDFDNRLATKSTSDLSEGTNLYYTNARVKAKLNDELVVSSSAQISNFNTFLEKEGDGVVSGSLQVNSLFAGTAVSTSLDSRIDSLEGSTHTHSNKANLDTINQDLANNDNVQFADLVLTGNLTVQGTTTTLNTQELTIEDKLLSVASGSTTTAAADGGGFHISGANASITWDNGNSRLAINKSTHFTGDVQATGDVIAYASSDERLKDEIKPIENPLQKINEISGNSFIWNEEKQNIYKGKDYGVIAQEVEKVLPELVKENEWGYKAVKYDKIVSLLIEGIKELSKEVTDLKNKIGE